MKDRFHKRGDRVDIENYIKECGYNSSNKLEDIINETIHDVLDSIDTSLMYLSDDIDSGNYSNKDIIERIVHYHGIFHPSIYSPDDNIHTLDRHVS